MTAGRRSNSPLKPGCFFTMNLKLIISRSLTMTGFKIINLKAGLSAVLIMLALWLAASPALAAVVSVVMPPENTVVGDKILLGDVAHIDVLNPQGEELAAALRQVELGPAPAAGEEVLLRRTQIEQRLVASKLNLSEADWSVPQEVRLTGRGQTLSEESLRMALEQYLAETEPYRSGKYSLINAHFGHLPVLPPGRVTYRFVPQSSSNPAYLAGNFFFSVDGRETARARVTAQVDLSILAVVAARPMSRGHVLNEDDVSLSMAPYAQAKGALTDPAMVVGNALKANLNAGDPIRDRNLTKSLMVRRGDMVTILAQQGGLKVSASGQARQDGSLGDTISVTNLNSKKNIAGRVIGPNMVEIVF
ncbi:flagella basal body P-ring formation protein FlgA [Deltaproteobacteria bacterium Smac51]|nr:flagella basal body P-ring formation protein FlgA [Deltaproteobacteria bacterium Smac51]